LEIDEKSSEITAEYISFLLQNGKHSGTFDVLIAGIAKARNLTLITNNTKDYQNFSGLQLDNWKD
jgi:tRNA(fMet)-specific endonuclease VapC